MGKIYNNLISTTAGFNYAAQQPLDDREVVQSYSDLDELVNSNISYEGIEVYVVDDKKSYKLINGKWKAIATENFVQDYVAEHGGSGEGGVGRETPDGGEIFNDYETNKALSKHATAIGSTNIAGSKAFTITATEDLGEGNGTYTLSSTTGLEVGMEYSAVLSKANYHAGRITAINENIVTVDGYVYYNLNTNVDNPEKFNMYNCFIITGRPDLGDKSIGFNAFASGYETSALGQNSHTAGLGTRTGADNQTVVGKYNTVVSDALFVVGNGTDNDSRKNAFEVKANGSVKIDNALILTDSTSGKEYKIYINDGKLQLEEVN